MVNARLALFAIVLVVGVSGHGWMMSPPPRSAVVGNGGIPTTLAEVSGSGNAATTSPCGKGEGNTQIVGTYSANETLTLYYKRANNHGNTGPTVEFKIFFMTNENADPTNADFETAMVLATGVTMDVNTNDPQSVTVELPPGYSGKAVIQFHWTPTSGGNWWDCAFIEVLSDGVDPDNNACLSPPNPVNGGCYQGNPVDGPSKATCIPKPDPTVRECRCPVGYYGDAIAPPEGTGCNEMPDNIEVHLRVLAPAANISQDVYTRELAALMGVPAGRVLYDRSEDTVVSGRAVIYFEVVGGPNGEDPRVPVDVLRNAVGNNDPALAALPHEVFSVQAVGIDLTSIQLGSGSPGDGVTTAASSGSGSTTGAAGTPSAGASTAPVVALVAAAVAVASLF